MNIYLMRHGMVDKPEGNALFGRADVKVCEQGWQQMLAAGAMLDDIHHVISSPLVRCANYAEYYSQCLNISCDIQADLQECDFGIWDGVPFDQLQEQWSQLEAFWQQPATVTPPGGESLLHMQQRVITCWKLIMNQSRGKNLLLVTHGGVIRLLLAFVLNLDWRNPALYNLLNISYASISKLTVADHTHAVPRVQYIGLSREVFLHD